MSPSNKLALLWFLGWRFSLFLTAFIASFLLPIFKESFPYSQGLIKTGFPSWLWSWANFDGVHYLGIAETAYGAYFTQAFFPLYPLLMSLLGRLFFFFQEPWQQYIFSGLIISNLAYILVIWLLYKLIHLDEPKLGKNNKLLWSVLLFPTSFFLVAAYSESLFLVFTLGCFYFLRQKKFWFAAFCAGMATGTRFVGVALLPALWWEYFLVKRKNWGIANWFIILGLTMLSLLGLGMYSLYLGYRFSDPLLFVHVQGAFGAQRSTGQLVILPQVLYRYARILTTIAPTSYMFLVALWEVGFTLAGLASLIVAYRYKIRFSYLIYSFVALIIPTLTGSLTSMPRYVLSAFPIFFVIARLPNSIGRTWIILSTLLLLVFVTLFVRGYWVA